LNQDSLKVNDAPDTRPKCVAGPGLPGHCHSMIVIDITNK